MISKSAKKNLLEFRKKYVSTLSRAKKEETMHRFLANNPLMTRNLFSDGAIMYDLINKFPLGTNFVTDLVVFGTRSYGIPYHCVLIELESPTAKPFTKSGNPAKELNNAIRQITEWNHWIQTHMDEFCMSLPKKMNIEPPADISKDLKSALFSFKIVIGRRKFLSEKDREYMTSFVNSHHRQFEIMTYDKIITQIDAVLDPTKYLKLHEETSGLKLIKKNTKQ